MVTVLVVCPMTGACHGKLWLECETAVNLIVVKKGERYNETGKIRI